LAIGIAGSILLSGCSTGADRVEPALRMDQVLRMPPAEEGSTLHLVTDDVEGCSGADHDVVDVSVEETDTEVILDAGVEVRSEPFCEIRSVIEDFTIELDRPLGQRVVIDDSRGRRSVIWSPEIRQSVLRRLGVTSSDAAAFVRAKFSGAQEISCRSMGPVLFGCTVSAPSRSQEVLIYVEVQSRSELKAFLERPSPALKEALKSQPME
jgi:hypothetical protein